MGIRESHNSKAQHLHTHDYIAENGVSKNDTVSNSENKSRKLVGVSNGVMISIDEWEKEGRDNLKGCLLYTSRCV